MILFPILHITLSIAIIETIITTEIFNAYKYFYPYLHKMTIFDVN